MLRKDPGSRLPGTVQTTPEPEIDQRDEDLLSEVHCDNPNIIERIRTGLRGQAERHVREVDGLAITARAGQFLDERPNAELVGVELIRQARAKREHAMPGSGGSDWVKFDPRKHPAGTATRVLIRQFFRLPDGGDGYPKVFLIEREECRCIGHRLALTVLQKMAAAGTIGPAGERLLREQGVPPVETLVEEVTAAQ